MEDCIVYLVWQLRQAKFEVRFTWPNLLYISWRHHEADYLTRQNPIIKAMMPEPLAHPKPVTSAKKKALAPAPSSSEYNTGRPAVAFNDEIDIIQSAPFPSGQVRRAIDYEPPPSFVQNMDRPGPGRQHDKGENHRGQNHRGQNDRAAMQTDKGVKGNVLADLWSFN